MRAVSRCVFCSTGFQPVPSRLAQSKVLGLKTRATAILFLLLLNGCSQMLAEQIVRAPNVNAPADARQDASSEELRKLYVDRQLKIRVGPPDATIAIWIFNPFRGPETFRFIGTGRQVHAELRRATIPATQFAEPKGTIFILHGIQDQM